MFQINDQMKTRFAESPEQFIEESIQQYVREESANRLTSFGNDPIFEEPLVGFAAGDDPLFDEYRKVVHEEHFSPREILTRHLAETLKIENPQLESVSVVSYILPANRETLKSNELEKEGPSLRWNHTRWKGQDFNNALSHDLAALLQTLGVYAMAPETSPFFKIMVIPGGFVSNWSQRHMAYAAGLGTFSLNEGFITKKGMAMRCGSLVVGMKLKPSARPYAHYRANCLFYAEEKCGRCISRCPGGALSAEGHDKVKCYRVLYEMQAPWLKGDHGPGYIGKYAGCGLCQTGVPCAGRIPAKCD
jgi:epoxyqueuosine reductase QueG